MYRIIFLNDRLYHFKIVNTQKCDLCSADKQNYIHFFWECKVSKELWKKILQYCGLSTGDLNFKQIILNQVNKKTNHWQNFLILLTKYHLFCVKCTKKQPNYCIIINNLEFIKKSERLQLNSTKSIKIFNNKWDEKLKHDNYVTKYLQQLPLTNAM